MKMRTLHGHLMLGIQTRPRSKYDSPGDAATASGMTLFGSLRTL